MNDSDLTERNKNGQAAGGGQNKAIAPRNWDGKDLRTRGAKRRVSRNVVCVKENARDHEQTNQVGRTPTWAVISFDCYVLLWAVSSTPRPSSSLS